MDATYRQLERKAFCRACGETLPKGTYAFVRYSWQLKQALIVCVPCVKAMGEKIQ